jgi:hypothetical protein
VLAKGSGMIDDMTDSVGLTSFIAQHPEQAAQIRPAGQVIDAQFLEQAKNRAVGLLAARGFVLEHGVPQNAAVDRQNRLLTLCLNAQSDIKKFAYAAFCDDIEYYNRHYASEASRSSAEPAVPVAPQTTGKA